MKASFFLFCGLSTVFCGVFGTLYVHLGDAAGVAFTANPLAMLASIGTLMSATAAIYMFKELAES